MPASAKTGKYEETQHGTGTLRHTGAHTEINVPNIYLEHQWAVTPLARYYNKVQWTGAAFPAVNNSDVR